VNTASRMESTGEAGRIHMSQETADLLIEANKASWIEKRKDVISAKGKGELQTVSH
jgi:class 3 adenylate cyclase